MGHRRYSAPRRGSLAFRPRGRAASPIPWMRTWPKAEGDKPTILGFVGFKAGCLHVVTMDDREKTPNFGKPLFNASTVLATPPLLICGFRAYIRNGSAIQSLTDVYMKDMPKETTRLVNMNPSPLDEGMKKIQSNLDKVKRLTVHAYVSPRDARLPQKTPCLLEIRVDGGDMKAQLEYVMSILGKRIPVSEFVKPGMYLDVSAVSKGQGFEGPVTRLGIKTKSEKSRKSVRAVGVIGPWHPAAVTSRVPRAGQMGFHHRTEFNKKVLAVGNGKTTPIAPKGGFPHFGIIDGDYIALRGSAPGPARRLVRLRLPVRKASVKILPPKVLMVSTTVGR